MLFSVACFLMFLKISLGYNFNFIILKNHNIFMILMISYKHLKCGISIYGRPSPSNSVSSCDEICLLDLLWWNIVSSCDRLEFTIFLNKAVIQWCSLNIVSSLKCRDFSELCSVAALVFDNGVESIMEDQYPLIYLSIIL